MDGLERYQFKTEFEAEEVLASLRSVIKRDGFATLGDFYTLVGLPSNYMDEQEGWTDLGFADVIRSEPRMYALKLPRLKSIDLAWSLERRTGSK